MKASRLLSLLMFLFLYACSDSQSSTLSGEGVELETARELFMRRGDNHEALLVAKNFIQNKLDTVPDVYPNYIDRMEASILLFRLTYYEAKHYYATDKSTRKKLLLENAANVDKYLSPATLGWEHPGYYYYKMQSLLAYADDGIYLEQLSVFSKILGLIYDSDKAAGSDIYEGGGMYRLEAEFWSREYIRGTPGLAYNPELSLKLIDYAIKADPYPGQYSGDLYCENFLLRAEYEYRVSKAAAKPSVYAAQLAEIFELYVADELIPPMDKIEAVECIAKAKNFAASKGVVIRQMNGDTEGHSFEFNATAYFSSTASYSGKVALEAYCGAWDLMTPPLPLAGSAYFDYDPSKSGKSYALSLTLSGDSVPCVPRWLAFNSDRISVSTSNVDVRFVDYGLTDEKYAADTKNQLDDTYSQQMANYSISMAQQALAQPNMFCNIQQATKNPRIDAGFIQKVKSDYYGVFGVLFDDPDHQFACPPTETLKGQINICVVSPSKSTPFCNSYRLYMQSLGWINSQLVETNRRLEKISNKESQIYKNLQTLSERLQEESDNSDEVLGED
jgi:hypothetical protein